MGEADGGDGGVAVEDFGAADGVEAFVEAPSEGEDAMFNRLGADGEELRERVIKGVETGDLLV